MLTLVGTQVRIGLPIQDAQAACMEVHQLCLEEYVDLGVEVESSGNLLLALLRHSVCQGWEEVEEAPSWFLKT